MIRLKRCPCCGGQTAIDNSSLFCTVCGLQINIVEYMMNYNADYEEAVELASIAWNRRK